MRKIFRYFLIAPFFGCMPGEEAGGVPEEEGWEIPAEETGEIPVEKVGELPVGETAKKQSSGGKYLAHPEEAKPAPGNRFQKWGLALYWLFAMLYWETLVHAGMYGNFRGSFRFALGFTAGLALLIALLVGFLPGRGVFPVSIVISVVLIVLYGSQLVYCFIFGTPYSVSQMGLGADAVSQFWREMFTTMADHIFWLLGLLVPLVLLVLLYKMRCLKKPGWIRRGVVLLLAAAALVLLLLILLIRRRKKKKAVKKAAK